MSFSRDFYIAEATKQGRSEKFIDLTVAYAESLDKKGLPVIFTPEHLSRLMGIEPEWASNIIRYREHFYKMFGIRKKNGSVRYILAPQGELKYMQHWVKKFILDYIVLNDFTTAYYKGSGIVKNASAHTCKDLVINIDLFKYFDSIKEDRVVEIFCAIGYNLHVAKRIAQICCTTPPIRYVNKLYEDKSLPVGFMSAGDSILPQGAPTSPAISNLAAQALDTKLNKYAKENGYSYTRYADDITLSGPSIWKPQLGTIKAIIEEEGFYVNENKVSYFARNNRQIVTGLNVNEKVTVSKSKRREILRHLHYCTKYGPYEHLKRIDGLDKSNYRDWLLGKICFIKTVHPDLGKKMFKMYNDINWVDLILAEEKLGRE